MISVHVKQADTIARTLTHFLSPDALHLFKVSAPTFGAEWFADLAGATASILFGQADQR